MDLEELLVAVAGFLGGFFSTLASNGSSVALPVLGLLGLPEHVANGTSRLSVLALGLVGTVPFARRGLIDWRQGPPFDADPLLSRTLSLAAFGLGADIVDHAAQPEVWQGEDVERR